MNRTKYALVALLIALYPGISRAQTPLMYVPDANGRQQTVIRPSPAYVDARVLAAGVPETHTLPGTARWVFFSADCPTFYAKPGATVAIPVADVTDGTASVLNPPAWSTLGITQISLVSATTCTVTLNFFR